MKRLSLALALSLALIASLTVAPAGADSDLDGVGILTSAVLQIGSSFLGTCDKDSTPGVTGEGITIPVLPGSTKGNRVFSLNFTPDPPTFPIPATLTVITQDTPTTVKTGAFHICGRITEVFGQTPVPGLGPWCGMSKGHNGVGKFRIYDPATNQTFRWLNITQLGWKFSVSSVLPVIAKIQQQDGTGATEAGKGAKVDNWATMFALVSARATNSEPGAGSCVAVDGGKVFRVDGLIALKSAGANEGETIHWNMFPGFGKCTDVTACPLYPEKKKQ